MVFDPRKMVDAASRAARAIKAVKKKKELRLRMELVPEPLWGHNLRSGAALGVYRWRKLRKSLLEKQGAACSICTSTNKPPYAHEVWDYLEDELTGTATLVCIKFVCRMCNFIKHYGLTTRLVAEGSMSVSDIEEVKQHFLQVNSCDIRDFEAHRKESINEHEIRSKKNWSINYGPYSESIKEAR